MGSARWASNPAEISSQVGFHAAIAGSTTSSTARRYTSPVVWLGNGRLRVVPGAGARADLVRSRRSPGTAATRASTRRRRRGRPRRGPGCRCRDGRRSRRSATRSPWLRQLRGGDGHVVEQAEAHGLAGERVVARRTHGAEPGVTLACLQPSNHLEPGAGRKQRSVPRRLDGERCPRRWPHRRPRRTTGAPAGTASGWMASSSWSRAATGATRTNASDRPACWTPSWTARSACGSLGMATAGIVVQEPRVRRVQDRHGRRLRVSSPDRPPRSERSHPTT